MSDQGREIPKEPELRKEVSNENRGQYVSTTISHDLFAINPRMLLVQIDLSVRNPTSVCGPFTKFGTPAPVLMSL